MVLELVHRLAASCMGSRGSTKGETRHRVAAAHFTTAPGVRRNRRVYQDHIGRTAGRDGRQIGATVADIAAMAFKDQQPKLVKAEDFFNQKSHRAALR